MTRHPTRAADTDPSRREEHVPGHPTRTPHRDHHPTDHTSSTTPPHNNHNHPATLLVREDA